MKKSLMGLVVVFLSMAVLIVSGRVIAECKPMSARKALKPAGYPAGLITSPTWASSGTTETFAKASGTSGCGGVEEPSAFIQQQEFVAWNIDNLSEDIAQGGGPHLRSLSALLGCPASDYPALAGMARGNFGRLFPSAEVDPEAFLARLKDDISHDSRLSENCVYA